MKVAPILAVALLALSGLPSAHAVAPTSVDGYTLSVVYLPGFAYLYPYLYNYRDAYPVLGFPGTGQCSAGILYITNASKLACYGIGNATVWNVSGALTLLHQRTSGIQGQIDNEFQLDTTYGEALLYGNLSTSPGPVTIESVNLTTGAILEATTPVPMANSIQCDYLGGGIVATLNGTGTNGAPELTNLSNGTSWRSGLSVGVATNNAYWVPELDAFIDVAGPHLAELRLTNGGRSMANVGNAWGNRTGVNSVTAADGIAYNAATSQIAVDEATNLGTERIVASVAGGLLTPKGAWDALVSQVLYLNRYTYTSSYDWALNGTSTVLVDPFTNGTQAVPNLVTRLNSSGADNDYEFTDPTTTARLLSLNVSLLGLSSRAPNEFVYAAIPPPPPIGVGGAVAQVTTLVVVLLGGVVAVECVGVIYRGTRRRGRLDGP